MFDKTKTLDEIKINDRFYLVCKEMERAGIKNCFTESLGGVSNGKIKGLNLGFRVGDKKEDVTKNYRLVCEDMGFEYSKMTAARQSHTDNIKVVTSAHFGMGISRETDFFDVDGLVCGEAKTSLVVYCADCFAVLLADKKRKAVAAVHSGWRGTEKKIAAKAAKVMKNNFGVLGEDIVAAIGPGIGPCCFETEWDTASRFESKYVFEKGGGKFLINLPLAICDSLLTAGVKKENIFVSNRCTVCENDRFYSYRSHKEKAGRTAAVISL